MSSCRDHLRVSNFSKEPELLSLIFVNPKEGTPVAGNPVLISNASSHTFPSFASCHCVEAVMGVFIQDNVKTFAHVLQV